jgi:4-hydroxysphinganine ceramide fatty acyl 2-hydroxylase
MPGRTLPTLSRAEVESHNSAKSCYVTIGSKVYDVTDFVEDHPGGADLILDYAGKDVEQILKDEASHPHSETAYEVLDESLVGFLVSEKSANGMLQGSNGQTKGDAEAVMDANGNWVHPRTGMSCEEDLSKETDAAKDFQKHKFLDLEKPLFKQIWFGGFSKEFYLDQVHRPRHYRGGQSAPLFGNVLEMFTLTPWWMVPTLWLPPVIYGTYLAGKGLSGPLELIAHWLGGLGLWTLLEYILHRFLFHLDRSGSTSPIFIMLRLALTEEQLPAR